MRFKAKVKIQLQRYDEIEFLCNGRKRIGEVQSMQGLKEYPYIVGFELEDDEPDYGDYPEDVIADGWATYGMRIDEFIRLIHRPKPVEE
ncbi:MAG: hypothetical protein JWO15_3550 [Sphingomonadales bacterium]|nr:hypothetical protein [Sphingomonadales bacterium]